MNIKIKKKILVCMLWLCAIACFTGFPWESKVSKTESKRHTKRV